MPETTKLHPDRYTVVCQRHLLKNYASHVDMNKANAVSKKLYREVVKAFTSSDGSYTSDDVMITLAMMVHRFGHEMTLLNPLNEWETDGFPEFCSLIGPDSGMMPIVRKGKA